MRGWCGYTSDHTTRVFYETPRAIESRALFLLSPMVVHQPCNWSALPLDSLNNPGAGTGDRVLSHETYIFVGAQRANPNGYFCRWAASWSLSIATVARSRPKVFDNDGPTSSRDHDHLDSIALIHQASLSTHSQKFPFPENSVPLITVPRSSGSTEKTLVCEGRIMNCFKVAHSLRNIRAA